MTDLTPTERTLEQVVIDHVGDYMPVEILKRDAATDPLELRDLLSGSTYMVEIRALPTGG